MAKFDTLLQIHLSFRDINAMLNGELETSKTVGVGFPPGGNKKSKHAVWMGTNRETKELRKDKNGRYLYNIKGDKGLAFRLFLDHAAVREAMAGDRDLKKSVGYAFVPGRSQIHTVFLSTTRENEDSAPEVRLTETGLVSLNIKLATEEASEEQEEPTLERAPY